MLRDFLREHSWTHRETVQEGVEQGLEQGRLLACQSIEAIVQVRFPELLPSSLLIGRIWQSYRRF